VRVCVVCVRQHAVGFGAGNNLKLYVQQTSEQLTQDYQPVHKHAVSVLTLSVHLQVKRS